MKTTEIQHIAFIMDGNRRWAKKHALPAIAGHRKGAEKLIEIAKELKKTGIKYMTVYAFSTENWNRKPAEVEGLMNLLEHYLDTSFKELQDNDVKIKFIGERYMLADNIIQKMNKIEQDTADNQSVELLIALSYGGRQEIVHAARQLAQKVADGKLSAEKIDMESFENCLYTAGVPDPDLLIRTSGEERISNYLLWQLAYTEFYFTKTLWPDINMAELNEILENYKNRERRYGKS